MQLPQAREELAALRRSYAALDKVSLEQHRVLRELKQRAANSASLVDELSTLLETLGIEDARTRLTQLAQQLRHDGTT